MSIFSGLVCSYIAAILASMDWAALPSVASYSRNTVQKTILRRVFFKYFAGRHSVGMKDVDIIVAGFDRACDVVAVGKCHSLSRRSN